LSSSYVRTQFKTFLGNNSAENIIDLTGKYLTLDEVISDEGLARNDPWLGIQFVGSSEDPTTIVSNNTTGKYREIGTVFFAHSRKVIEYAC